MRTFVTLLLFVFSAFGENPRQLILNYTIDVDTVHHHQGVDHGHDSEPVDWYLQATVRVTEFETLRRLYEISDVTVKESWNDEYDYDKLKTQLSLPFEVTLSDHVFKSNVVEIKFHRDDTPASKNIKRGMLTMAQYSGDPEQPYQKVQEDGIYGKCDTVYLSSYDKEKGHFKLDRLIDHAKCTQQRKHMKRHVTFDMSICSPGSEVLHRTARGSIDWKLGEKAVSTLIEKMELNNDKVPMVVTKQKLEFLRGTTDYQPTKVADDDLVADSFEIERPTTELPTSSNFWRLPMSMYDGMQYVANANKLIDSILANVDQATESNAIHLSERKLAQKFRDLIEVISFLTPEDIAKVFNHEEKAKRIRLLMAAASGAGNLEAQEAVKQFVIANAATEDEVLEKQLKFAIADYLPPSPFLAVRVNDDFIKSRKELCELDFINKLTDLRRLCTLSTSALLAKNCFSENSSCRQTAIDELDGFLNKLTADDTSIADKNLYLKAATNMLTLNFAPDLGTQQAKLLKIIDSILQDATLNEDYRRSAGHSLQYVSFSLPSEDIQAIALRTLHDDKLNLAIRFGAYLAFLYSKPSNRLLESVLSDIAEEIKEQTFDRNFASFLHKYMNAMIKDNSCPIMSDQMKTAHEIFSHTIAENDLGRVSHFNSIIKVGEGSYYSLYKSPNQNHIDNFQLYEMNEFLAIYYSRTSVEKQLEGNIDDGKLNPKRRMTTTRGHIARMSSNHYELSYDDSELNEDEDYEEIIADPERKAGQMFFSPYVQQLRTHTSAGLRVDFGIFATTVKIKAGDGLKFGRAGVDLDYEFRIDTSAAYFATFSIDSHGPFPSKGLLAQKSIGLPLRFSAFLSENAKHEAYLNWNPDTANQPEELYYESVSHLRRTLTLPYYEQVPHHFKSKKVDKLHDYLGIGVTYEGQGEANDFCPRNQVLNRLKKQMPKFLDLITPTVDFKGHLYEVRATLTPNSDPGRESVPQVRCQLKHENNETVQLYGINCDIASRKFDPKNPTAYVPTLAGGAQVSYNMKSPTELKLAYSTSNFVKSRHFCLNADLVSPTSEPLNFKITEAEVATYKKQMVNVSGTISFGKTCEPYGTIRGQFKHSKEQIEMLEGMVTGEENYYSHLKEECPKLNLHSYWQCNKYWKGVTKLLDANMEVTFAKDIPDANKLGWMKMIGYLTYRRFPHMHFDPTPKSEEKTAKISFESTAAGNPTVSEAHVTGPRGTMHFHDMLDSRVRSFLPHYHNEYFPLLETVLHRQFSPVCYNSRNYGRAGTFDQKQYSMKGHESCTHVLVQDCANNLFSVTQSQDDVVIRAGNSKRTIVRVASGRDVYVDGAAVEFNKEAKLFDAFKIVKLDQTVTVVFSDGMENLRPALMVSHWQGYTAVIVAHRHRGALCGLCGDMNGDWTNDWTSPDGCLQTDVNKFISSWTLPSSACPSKVEPDKCTN